MTPEEIARLREICKNATPGPWKQGESFLASVMAEDGIVTDCLVSHQKYRRNEERIANSLFIATARTALPALLDEVERLNTEVAKLRGGFMLIHENARLREALREISNECPHDDGDSGEACSCSTPMAFLAREALKGGGG